MAGSLCQRSSTECSLIWKLYFGKVSDTTGSVCAQVGSELIFHKHHDSV